MKKKARPESFIRQPQYPGGNKAMEEFIRSNLQYPEEAINNKVEGTVTVKYDLNVFGEVTEVSVVHGIGYGCDEEAIRLVKLLRFEKKKYKGLHVVFHRSIHIHFQLLTGKAVPMATQVVVPSTAPEMRVNYLYSETKSSPTDKEKITYTIIPGK